MNIEPTLWTNDEYSSKSEASKTMQIVREQIIPREAEERVVASGGMAKKYYVYGRPKTGGMVIAKDSEGINVVTDRVLLGEFDTEEEARSFQHSLDRLIGGNNG